MCCTQMVISMCHASLLLAGICIFGVMGGIKLKRTFLLAFIVMQVRVPFVCVPRLRGSPPPKQLVYHPVVLGIAFGIAESGVICDIIKDDHACEILTDVYKWTTVGEAGLTVSVVSHCVDWEVCMRERVCVWCVHGSGVHVWCVSAYGV